MTRTDVHRPAEIDPADYALVAEGDRGTSEDPGYEYWVDPKAADANYVAVHESSLGDLRCQHCGQHGLRFYAIYLHGPTGELLLVGDSCATKLALDSRSAAARRKARDAHAREAKRTAWIESTEGGEEIAAYLEENYLRNDFLASLRSALRKWGNLSEKQLAAVRRNIEKDAERKAERAIEDANDPDPAPIPDFDGRTRIEGRILAVKFVEGMYGTTEKMLVLDDRGFKVWGTRPTSLLVPDKNGIEYVGEIAHRPADRGDRVAFDAKIERSEKDETFGFFSRPTKGVVVETNEDRLARLGIERPEPKPEPTPEPKPEPTAEECSVPDCSEIAVATFEMFTSRTGVAFGEPQTVCLGHAAGIRDSIPKLAAQDAPVSFREVSR